MHPYDDAAAGVRHRLERLGARLAGIRLGRNLTQRELAEEAGTTRQTIIRLERGAPVSLDTFIRVLDALGLPTDFDALLPDPSVRPVERIRLRGHERQRARPRGSTPQKASEWAWGDEADE